MLHAKNAMLPNDLFLNGTIFMIKKNKKCYLKRSFNYMFFSYTHTHTHTHTYIALHNISVMMIKFSKHVNKNSS